MNYRIIFALVLCSLAFAASAQTTMGLHTFSVHAPDGNENNDNFGAYVQHKRLIVGGYRNSLNRDTGYVGYVHPLGHGFDAMIGVASGYSRKCESYTIQTGEKLTITKHKGEYSKTTTPVYETRERCSGFGRGYFVPAAALGYTAPFSVLGATPKLTLVPGFKHNGSVLHLSFQVAL